MPNDSDQFIAAPMDPMVPGISIQGVPVLIVADLPAGGFLEVRPGENPLAQAVPSVQLAKGTMLAVIPVEIATQLRPLLKKVRRASSGAILPGEFRGAIPE